MAPTDTNEALEAAARVCLLAKKRRDDWFSNWKRENAYRIELDGLRIMRPLAHEMADAEAWHCEKESRPLWDRLAEAEQLLAACTARMGAVNSKTFRAVREFLGNVEGAGDREAKREWKKGYDQGFLQAEAGMLENANGHTHDELAAQRDAFKEALRCLKELARTWNGDHKSVAVIAFVDAALSSDSWRGGGAPMESELAQEQYREGHEYFVCDECGSHMEIDADFRRDWFDPDLHSDTDGAFWGATCDNGECEADLSPFVFNPHFTRTEP